MEIAVIIELIIVIIFLIVFFVMASNISATKKEIVKNNEYFLMLLQLKELEMNSSGVKPLYYLINGNVKIKDKRKSEEDIDQVTTMSFSQYKKLKETEDVNNFEIVPFKSKAIDTYK